MKEYLFYTAEGTTYGPNGEDVDNCQVLGRGFGNDNTEALHDLLERNPWIIEKGFDPYEAMYVVLDTFNYKTFIREAENKIGSELDKGVVINLSTYNIHDIIVDTDKDYVEEIYYDKDGKIMVSFTNAYGQTHSTTLAYCHKDTIADIVNCILKKEH